MSLQCMASGRLPQVLLASLLIAPLLCASADGSETVDRAPGYRTPLLSDEPIPLQLEDFPERPGPLLELGGNDFFAPGPIPRGHVLPTGAVLQPQFVAWGQLRSAIQHVSLADGSTPLAGETATTEWVNRLDLFGALYLTPTERFVVSVQPLHGPTADGSTGWFGYRAEPRAQRGSETGLDADIETFFFEGDVASLFRFIDPDSVRKADYHVTIGRQPLVMQQGLLSMAPLDMIGITRTSTYALGSNSTRATLLYAWDNLFRNDNRTDPNASMVGVSVAADYHKQLWEFDALFVDSEPETGGDSWHAAIAVDTQINVVNTTLRLLGSGVDGPDSATASDGALLFGQFSVIQPFTENLIYLNTFYGHDRFASAARAPSAGGPLGQTGILFAAVGMGRFAPALGNRADHAFGAGLGWQIYTDAEKRSQWLLEAGFRNNRETGTGDATAVAARYQQALGRRTIALVEGYHAWRSGVEDITGLRAELRVKF